MAGPALSYCAEQVRCYDHDRYLTCLFAPAQRREPLFALYAFNLEVAKTAEVVSEPMLGRVRLQWWRDAVEAMYAGRPPPHEAIGPLAGAVAQRGLSRAHFERLIDAREFDLDGEAPESLPALEDYAEGTSASVVLLALEILGAAAPAAQAAARHAGIAWALAGLLRAVPFHARRKRLYLPQDLVGEAGLKVGDLFELRSSPALRRVVERIAARATEHLGLARAGRGEVPRAALPALLIATLAERELAVLRKSNFDPLRPAVQAKSPWRAWRLTWARLRGRY
ncbi:MAG: phytoene/squalene synthase family protein [Kiloniellaceae bacterium]